MSLDHIVWAFGCDAGGSLEKLTLIVLSDMCDMDGFVATGFSTLCSIIETDGRGLRFALRALRERSLVRFDTHQPVVVQLMMPGCERPLPISSRQLARRLIFERDGFRCVYCGSTDRLEVDHVVPRARGGANVAANLATACRPCNASKGSLDVEEWKSRWFGIVRR